MENSQAEYTTDTTLNQEVDECKETENTHFVMPGRATSSLYK